MSWIVRLNHYHNLGATERRVRGLLEGFRFSTVSSVLRRLDASDRLAAYRIQ